MAADQIAFIGGGNMGRALVAGLIAHGTAPAQIAVADPSEAVRQALAADFGVRTGTDNAALAASADIVVLAVKPQGMAGVLAALAPQLAARRPLLISIAAGVRTASIAGWSGTAVPIVRAMPNRPALLGAGITGLFATADTPPTARARAEAVMGAVGELVWVQTEDDLDVVTAVSGSGPAYFFLLAEQLALSAVRRGLDPHTARRLAVATLHGAGRMAAEGDGDFARLRTEVTSPGGTTEAALKAFAAARFDGIVAAAVDAAVLRGRELSEAKP